MPEKVLPFIREREDFDLDHVLTLCQRNNIIECIAHLYERLGS
jgi:hypothetical protein